MKRLFQTGMALLIAQELAMGHVGTTHQEKPVRKCRNCQKKHQHNNFYCSVGCCKEWRAAHGGNN